MCRHNQLCTLTVHLDPALGWRLRTWLVAFGHFQGLVARLACAWQHSATWLLGWWRSAYAPWPPQTSASFPATFFLPLSQTCAGIGMWEEEGPIPASCSCARENPPPVLTIDDEHCHFNIISYSYTLISGGLGTIQTLLSEWLSPLLLLRGLGREWFLSLAG